MTARMPFGIAFGTLVMAILVLGAVAHTRPIMARQPLKTFPQALQTWQGQTEYLLPGILANLKVDDYLLRLYSDRSTSPVWFYVGFWGSQGLGTRVHSPAVCLPGAGWSITSLGLTSVGLPDRTLWVNRAVVEKADSKEMVLYWYQIHGRVVAKDLEAMGFLAWTALTNRQSDEALVRINTPVVGAPQQALEREVAFVRAAFPYLDRLLPK